MCSIRKAEIEDLDTILGIYEVAREFMRETGNPNQWRNTNPTEHQIRDDIEKGKCMVICDEVRIHGVFALCQGEDPTYSYIEDGSWINQKPYVTIHRIASDQKVRGIFGCAMKECLKYADSIRIDTHKDNKVMQSVLAKHGFQRCGRIYLANGEPREAYQWVAQG